MYLKLKFHFIKTEIIQWAVAQLLWVSWVSGRSCAPVSEVI